MTPRKVAKPFFFLAHLLAAQTCASTPPLDALHPKHSRRVRSSIVMSFVSMLRLSQLPQ